jgi:hypothetical protein
VRALSIIWATERIQAETDVYITPELIKVVTHKNEYPAIERVLADHGIVTFALAYDLVKEHSDGNVTIRQIPSLTDLSTGIAYDLVEALYSILDLGDNELAPTTDTPADFDEGNGNLLEELTDK